MGRSQESFNKKEVRNKKEKKRKDKEKKRLARKNSGKGNSLDDMIAYVDEHGNITDIAAKLGEAFTLAFGGNEKNAQTGQQKKSG